MTVQITITPTRNENLVTFTLDRELVPLGTGLSFSHSDAASTHPLAQELFHIPGVESLWFLGHDVQVTKSENSRWSSIQSQVIETIKSFESSL